MTLRPLSLAQHTLYAELLDQDADDLFDPDLPENGSLLIRRNRPGAPAEHAYYQGYRPSADDGRPSQRYARYLGRVDDPDVAAQIARFQRVKAVRAERITTVRALIGAGMPRPDRITGRIIEAFARAGLFPKHAVLIGEVAYQTYSGVLGVRLPKPRKGVWGDRPAIAIVVRDRNRLPRINEAVHAVDSSFAIAWDVADLHRPKYGVAVVVTSLDHADTAATNRLGFLVADPVRALVLHGPGIPVSVPAPERFAVHQLIGNSVFKGPEPIRQFDKPDVVPLDRLIEGVWTAGRGQALARQIEHACAAHPEWCDPIIAGIRGLQETTRAGLERTLKL